MMISNHKHKGIPSIYKFSDTFVILFRNFRTKHLFLPPTPPPTPLTHKDIFNAQTLPYNIEHINSFHPGKGDPAPNPLSPHHPLITLSCEVGGISGIYVRFFA